MCLHTGSITTFTDDPREPLRLKGFIIGGKILAKFRYAYDTENDGLMTNTERKLQEILES